MSKFRKKKKGMPAVNTAALPDIVFMLLDCHSWLLNTLGSDWTCPVLAQGCDAHIEPNIGLQQVYHRIVLINC